MDKPFTLLCTGISLYIERKKANDSYIEIAFACIEKIHSIPTILKYLNCSERFEIDLQEKYNSAEQAVGKLTAIFTNYFKTDSFQEVLDCFKNFLNDSSHIQRDNYKEKHQLIYNNIYKYFPKKIPIILHKLKL